MTDHHTSANQLESQIAASAFWRSVGWQIDRIGNDFVRVLLPYNEGNTTAATALHGGAIAATLDIAGCLATGTLDNGGVRTLACDVSYVAGALGEEIYGEGEVLRRGKEIVYCSVRAVNAKGKLLAFGNHISHLSVSASASGVATTPMQLTATVRQVDGPAAPPASDQETVTANVALLRKMDKTMPYMAQLGWQFIDGAFGQVEFFLPADRNSLGAGNGLAGGALLSAVDHAGSLAAWMTRRLGDRSLFGSTVNTKLQTFKGNIDRNVRV